MTPFTLEMLARALESHVLARDVDPVAAAREFWDIELEGHSPRTERDVDAFLETLVDDFGDSHRSRDGLPDLTPFRRVLREVLDGPDADAAIARYQALNTPRGRRHRHPPATARRPSRVGWWIYWAIATVTVATVVVVAARTGMGENLALASILVPGLFLIVAGIARALLGQRR